MATTREVFALVVQADVAGGAQAIRSFATGAKKDLGDVQGSAQQMAASLQRGGAQVAAAGAAGLAAFTAMGLGARKAAGEVIGLQRVAGGSVEDVSKLRFAAQQTGVGLDSLTTGLVRLSKSASSDKGASMLARYGIAARDASGEVRPLGDLLTDVADAVKALPAGAAKNDLVTTVFGRGGASLLPLLNRGADGLDALGVKAEQFGAVLDGDTLEAAKRFTLAQRDMAAASEALEVSIGSAVLPTLAKYNEALARVGAGAAKSFESLPEGVRDTAVAAGMAASGLASVAGTVVSFGGSAYLASQGVAALSASGFTLGGAAAAAAPPLAALVAIIGSVTYALTELQDQQNEVADLWAISETRIAQAFNPKIVKDHAQIVGEIAGQLAQVNEVGPMDAADKIRDWVGLYGEAEEKTNRLAVAEKELAKLRTVIADVPPGQARQVLDEIAASMERAGMSATAAKGMLRPLYDELKSTAPIDAKTNMELYADAVDAAARKTVGLRDAMGGLRDGVDPGELTVFADAAKRATDPLFALSDANDAVARAQKRLVEASRTDTREIQAAYKRLADAKARLDEVLRGDDDGLDQVSPEAQIADARRRVLEADTALAQNPKDGAALAKRDEALADEDRAIKRRQELKREEAQRAREVKDARAAVAEAQQGVRDAQTKNGEDLQQAQADLNKAYIDQASATIRLADGIVTGAVKIEDVGRSLQLLVDTGIIPQSAKDQLMAKFGDLADQAQRAADKLGEVAKAPVGVAGAPGSPVLGPPAPGYRSPSFVGPLAPGERYSSTQPSGNPYQAVAQLPVKGYTADEIRRGVPKAVDVMRSERNYAALIDAMRRRSGRFPGFAQGGIVPGYGTGDIVPSLLTPGEGVVTTAGMRLLGASGLAALNSGRSTTSTSTAPQVVTHQGDTIHITEAYRPRETATRVAMAKRRARFLRAGG